MISSKKAVKKLAKTFCANGFCEYSAGELAKAIGGHYQDEDLESFIDSDLEQIIVTSSKFDYLDDIGFFDDIPESKISYIDADSVLRDMEMSGEYTIFEVYRYVIIVSNCY